MKICLVGVALGLALALLALAQGLPDRPISLSSGYAPRGSTDITARLVAERMRRQTPDGTSLMLMEASSHALIPNAMQGGTRYDPVNNFTQIAVVANGPLSLVAAPNLPANNATEVIAKFRAGPQENMPYASSGVGSMPHFAAEAVAVSLMLAGKFSHVPYRSGGLMVESIARGDTAWGVAVLASAAAQVRDNRVRGIAITGLERFPAFPDIPTLAESGMPSFDIGNWFAVVGPPRMPEGTVTALNRAMNTALTDPQLRERFLIVGISPWTRPNSPADTRAFFQAELLKFKGVVERTDVKIEQ